MIGRTLAHYEITGHLGTGGMGEVYQATDSRLGRSVAIKLLPEEFAQDGERVARFQREARVLAAMNHPNIASIHGLEESSGRHFLVMELVPGETLANRIRRGPVPLDEALSIARQIADALDSAHERGIVHRDLKPSNIKVTPEGTVKVLDFGLAKAFESEPSNFSLSNSPTISSAATQHGVILGTAGYMSPEQARGKAVDRRADIWAFGIVLYEMVAGKRLFEGETVSDTLAAVLERNVTLDAAPSKIRPLLKSCLERDPKKRLRDIGDAWRLVDLPVAESVSSSHDRRSRLLLTALSVLLVAALVPAALYFLSSPEEAPEMRFESPAAGNDVPYLSPDGKRIAYVAPHDGKNVIWVREIGALEPKPLRGTENPDGVSLFWSPDNQNLGFASDGKLRRVDTTSGVVQTIHDGVVIPLGGAWNAEGDILIPSVTADGPNLMRITSSGDIGTVVIPPVKAGEGIAIFPQFLPDGRRFLYHTVPNAGATGTVYVGSLDSRTSSRLMEIPNFGPAGNSLVRFVEPGYLLFTRNRTLYAQAFDAKDLTRSSEPVAIAQKVGEFSASDHGTIIYRPQDESLSSTGIGLLWMDRQGKPAGLVPTPGVPGSIDLSRDDHQIVLDTNMVQPSDVWVIDTRGIPQVVANSTSMEAFPVWTPAGRDVVYAANRSGRPALLGGGIYRKAANGVGAEESLFSSQDVALPQDWSPDGSMLVFELFNLANVDKADLWVLPMSGDKKARPFLETPARETHAQISPDGTYIAYSANAAGGYQIVVRTFPEPNKGAWTITSNGGTEPRWRGKDGAELFYLSADRKLMAVEVARGSTSSPFGSPKELFMAPPLFIQARPNQRRYDVSADGQKFLFAAVAPPLANPAASRPIVTIVNWTRALPKN